MLCFIQKNKRNNKLLFKSNELPQKNPKKIIIDDVEDENDIKECTLSVECDKSPSNDFNNFKNSSSTPISKSNECTSNKSPSIVSNNF